MGELDAAIGRLNDRKIAIGAVADEARTFALDETLKLVSGLDLDPAELRAAEMLNVNHGVEQCLEGVPLHPVLGSVWLDGIITGMLVAEARSKTGSS